MVDPKLLPTGARADRKFAEEIAANPERLAASYAYWLEQYRDLQESTGLVAATEFTRFTENVTTRNLRAAFPERQYLTEPADEKIMVSYADCLVSVRELARHLRIRSVRAVLEAFEEAAQRQTSGNNTNENLDQNVVKGIRCAREYFDLMRRIIYCQLNAERLELNIDELLALFRQEGALAITPPQDSYEHAPLIETEANRNKRTCRPDWFLFGEDFRKPGFNLTFPLNDQYGDTRRTLEAVRNNLMAVGGLDTVAGPPISSGDELFQIMEKLVFLVDIDPKVFAQYRSIVRLHREYVSQLEPGGFGRGRLWAMLQGLAKTDLELRQNTPSFDSLLDAVVDRLDTLFETHRVEVRDNRAFLLGSGEETLKCLEVQGDWYKSRKALRTLLAYRDRTAMEGLEQSFSPFVTYLRYHLGDIYFVLALARVVPRLGELYSSWPRSKRDKLNAVVYPNGIGFREAFENSRWFQDEGRRDELMEEVREAQKNLRKVTRQNPDLNRRQNRARRESFKWHFVGLTDALLAQSSDEPWRRMFGNPRRDDNLRKMAQYAAIVVRPIAELGLVQPLCIALEFLPVSGWQRYYGIFRSALLNTHSFERLRLAYQQAGPATSENG